MIDQQYITGAHPQLSTYKLCANSCVTAGNISRKLMVKVKYMHVFGESTLILTVSIVCRYKYQLQYNNETDNSIYSIAANNTHDMDTATDGHNHSPNSSR